MMGRVLAMNTVLDEARRVSFVNFGEVVASHAAAVAFVERFVIVPVPRRFATVVTSAAGYPLDKTYYQTVKGMVAPKEILAPGANLIIASECSEGRGSKEYVAAQRRLVALGEDGFLGEIAGKRFADVDEWQTQMQVKPMKLATVQLYTRGLAPDDRALTGVAMVDSVERAVAESVRRSGDRAVAVIPEGPYVLPALVEA
jgi:nickel-dependent lactate racemase